MSDPYPVKNEGEAATIKHGGPLDVFESLVHVIRGARGHFSTNQVDSAEFWCRGLDEYERTLTPLPSRVEESRAD